jgi:hypothetical protein
MVEIAVNRPVHLARRDAHYRQCVELLRGCSEIASVARRRVRIRRILDHVQEAYQEAIYALRGYKGSRAEKQFVRYLDLTYDAAKAAQVMVQHEALLKEDKSFMPQFLGASTAKLVGFEVAHRGMVGKILNVMNEIASLASDTFQKLRKNNMEALSPNESKRYQNAYRAAMSL